MEMIKMNPVMQPDAAGVNGGAGKVSYLCAYVCAQGCRAYPDIYDDIAAAVIAAIAL